MLRTPYSTIFSSSFRLLWCQNMMSHIMIKAVTILWQDFIYNSLPIAKEKWLLKPSYFPMAFRAFDGWGQCCMNKAQSISPLQSVNSGYLFYCIVIGNVLTFINELLQRLSIHCKFRSKIQLKTDSSQKDRIITDCKNINIDTVGLLLRNITICKAMKSSSGSKLYS